MNFSLVKLPAIYHINYYIKRELLKYYGKFYFFGDVEKIKSKNEKTNAIQAELILFRQSLRIPKHLELSY